MELNITLPIPVARALSVLEACGYEGFIVGGCVRDCLIGRTPNDWDITTNATPEQMKACFADFRVIETGIRHGTLTVIVDGMQLEITTYRNDGEYLDNRHPVQVTFSEHIEDDLSRRDFTMNAICYNENDGFTDIFSGKEDIERGVIRTVGDPERRFEEDALRILRGIRFAATLGFSIEDATAKAIKSKAHLLSAVSSERVATEWKKLIAGDAALRVISDYRDVIAVVIPELENPRIPDGEAFYSEGQQLRELMLFYLTHGQRAAKAYECAARRLKYDNKTLKFGVTVLENLTICDTHTDPGLKTMLMRLGKECADGVVRLAIMLTLCEKSAHIRLKELAEKSVWQLSALSVNGKDITSLGIRGEEVGRILNTILLMVLRDECANEKEVLISVAKRLKGDKNGV